MVGSSRVRVTEAERNQGSEGIGKGGVNLMVDHSEAQALGETLLLSPRSHGAVVGKTIYIYMHVLYANMHVYVISRTAPIVPELYHSVYLASLQLPASACLCLRVWKARVVPGG